VRAADLDRGARAQLKTLAKDNADDVARHLAMAARLIEDDPGLAHRHALSAARRAGRIAVVRETLAITAYTTGDYALALRELRTYRRISGRDDQLPMMVDSERGLGRPDRALELARSVPRADLPVEVRVELAIAMSGARLDLGQPELALGELEIPQLDPDRAFAYSPGLFDAYAAVLDELGRFEDADRWRRRSDLARDALAPDDDGGEDEVIEVVEEVDEHPTGETDGDEVTARAVAGDESAAVESGAVESGAVESGAVESGAVESGAVESGAVESGAVESGAGEEAPVEAAAEDGDADGGDAGAGADR